MKYFSNYVEDKQTEVFNNHGAFFAFGQKQLEEKRKEGVKYVHLGGGLICPKETYKQLMEDLDKIHEQGVHEDVKENGADGIIEREYFNHEQQIAYDDINFMDALKKYKEYYPEEFSDANIKRVSKDCWNKAVKNDWF